MKEDEFVLDNVSDKKASALSTSLNHEAYPDKQFSEKQNKFQLYIQQWKCYLELI